MASADEEEIPPLHLSLESGDNSVKSHHTPNLTEYPQNWQLSEYVASDTLYLSRKGLREVVDCVLKNTILKNLYLEGNQISSLPDSLFTSLPNLEWLDLRYNQITSLPAEIGLHRCLKTLLLEGNPIAELPLQLGNVLTLNALSLRHCPVTFPPQEIVQKGLQCILQYLRSAMVERPLSRRTPRADMPAVEKLQLSELVKSNLELCHDVVDEVLDDDELHKFRDLRQKMILMDRAEGHYPTSALQLADLGRTAGGDLNTKTYPLPTVKRKKEFPRGSIFPELPPFDTQYWKRSDDRRRAAMTELKEKQAILEQRRRDQELLKEWRCHARVMQERKILEHKQERRERHQREETLKRIVSECADAQLRKSRSEAPTGLASDGSLCLQCAESVILQRPDPHHEGPLQLVSQRAPYAVDSQISMSDSVESTAHHPPLKLQRQRSFLSQKEYDEARMARDRELELRIRSHVQMMQQRRRRPSGTVQEATTTAKKDLKEAQKLQSELAARKMEQDLEYRFVAFTGESSTSGPTVVIDLEGVMASFHALV
ncbi:leucine-rich repeat-containing protein 27-like [Aplochiton taeniatus]